MPDPALDHADRLRQSTVGIPACDDDPHVLSRALRALQAENLPVPPLVVDMSRREEVKRAVQSSALEVRYVPFRDSSGLSESRNRILELAETRFVLFIDADAVPAAGWARALATALDPARRVWLAGARIVPEWPVRPPPLFTSTVALELLGMLDLGPRPMEIPRVMGTSFAIDTESPGRPGFREDLGRRPGSLLSGEEVGLSLDVLAAGGRILYEPAATVRHFVRRERVSWRWMLRRAYSEGHETGLWPQRLEPFPRPLRWRDRVFQLAMGPAFRAGHIRAAGR